MTIINFRGNRFQITNQSDPDLVWPVNPVSMQWIQTISPNQLIPMEWRRGFLETLRGSIGSVFCPPCWGSGGSDTAVGRRWVETMLPSPSPRTFWPTRYFGPAVSAWFASLRIARPMPPTPEPDLILELLAQAFVKVALVEEDDLEEPQIL